VHLFLSTESGNHSHVCSSSIVVIYSILRVMTAIISAVVFLKDLRENIKISAELAEVQTDKLCSPDGSNFASSHI